MQGYFAALGGVVQAMAALAPALSMLAVFALIFGGIRLWRRSRDRRKAILMFVLSVVLFGNVLIWTL